MKTLTPIKAIRQFCCQCCGNNQKLPALCVSLDCVLHDYRQGKNPARKGIGGKTKRVSIIDLIETIPKRQEIIITGNKRLIIEDIEKEKK